jgi:hypothetical protein
MVGLREKVARLVADLPLKIDFDPVSCTSWLTNSDDVIDAILALLAREGVGNE